MEKLGTVNGPDEWAGDKTAGRRASEGQTVESLEPVNRGQTMTAKIELCVIRQNL